MSVTFPVSEVGKKSEEGFWTGEGYYKPQLMELKSAFNSLAKNRGYMRPEATGGPEKVLHFGQADGLFQATHTAFEMHYGLALAPDHIWLTIARQVAKHITEHAEELRKKFVDHEGQELIELRRDSFVKGSPDNDWQGAFAEFSAQIGKRIKVDHSKFLNTFSTTGPVEKAASEVVLMDAMSKYFKYGMRTLCGIPEITLHGTIDDWAEILARVRSFEDIGLGEWGEELSPVIQQFVATAAGAPDREWWQSFYKYRSASGTDSITGHITKLYRAKVAEKSGYMVRAGERVMKSDNFADQISKVPFIWKYLGQEYRMELWAGLPFATLENGVIRPVAAWAVAEAR